jgi:hypothetical protein
MGQALNPFDSFLLRPIARQVTLGNAQRLKFVWHQLINNQIGEVYAKCCDSARIRGVAPADQYIVYFGIQLIDHR